MKDFRISPSLREKVYDLLGKYDPSDIAYTIVGSVWDKSNKTLLSKPHDKDEAKKLVNRKKCYDKAARRFLATAKSLKLMEMQYLQ